MNNKMEEEVEVEVEVSVGVEAEDETKEDTHQIKPQLSVLSATTWGISNMNAQHGRKVQTML
jgi:hypothetical protein